MKKVILIVLLLLPLVSQSQQLTATTQVEQVAHAQLDQPKEISKYHQIVQELELLKKENAGLKKLMHDHLHCLSDESYQKKIAGLDASKVRRPKKGKSNQNTLPPPL